MTAPPSTTPAAGNVASGALAARVTPIGEDLRRDLRLLADSLPREARRPSAMARELGLSRVIISRLLGAIAKDDPIEVLQRLPGPESLRAFVAAAVREGADDELASRAYASIERFAELIRHDFGTRGALHTALSPHQPASQLRVEHASRYQVFKGMREVLGVDADAWLTCMMFVPHPADDEAVSVTTIHGAIGMRRLRTDVNVYFTFGLPTGADSARRGPHASQDISPDSVRLDDCYTHEPATLDAERIGDQVFYRLVQDRVGRRASVDMLAVSHDPRGSRRHVTDGRRFAGVAAYPDVPVKLLVCDALVHRDIYPGTRPEPMAYHLGLRGPANPNDPRRDIDRMPVREQVEDLSADVDRFHIHEVPQYARMVDRLCRHVGHPVDSLRVYRLRVAYPVHGFQHVLAFAAPTR